MSSILEQDKSIFQLLKELSVHVSYRRKMQFLLLSIMLPIGGLTEVISLGAVLPLITFLIEPEKIFQYKYIHKFAEVFQIEKAEPLGVLIFIAFGMLVLGSALFRIGLIWIMTRVSFGCGADLCVKAYRIALYQPYVKHISQHSSTIIAGISGKVATTASMMQQILLILNSLTLSVMIVGVMLLVSPMITAILVLGFAIVYVGISRLAFKRLKTNSKEISIQSENLVKCLQEGLGAIRDVLIDGTQQVFVSAFQKADLALRKAQCNNTVIASSPKFIVEASIILLITTVAFGYSKQSEGLLGVLPVFGMLVLAAQRLLPTMQQIYASWVGIAGMKSSLSDALDLLNRPMPNVNDTNLIKGLEFKKNIEAKLIQYRYSSGDALILKDISFVIPWGSRVGIIGPTGSGKSTLLDILMGLLTPSGGQLVVDGVVIENEKISEWQKLIAHVPQNIFLTDATLAENIAFGVPYPEINMERVRQAAKKAQISDFINELKDGYETLAGEYGARLSGGQRQRIGIARALYKKAKILMLDEATSALDETTERSFMEAVNGLDKEMTILIIAHRMTTIEICDLILEIDSGQLCEIRKMKNQAIG